jgi:hypothetical protein
MRYAMTKSADQINQGRPKMSLGTMPAYPGTLSLRFDAIASRRVYHGRGIRLGKGRKRFCNGRRRRQPVINGKTVHRLRSSGREWLICGWSDEPPAGANEARTVMAGRKTMDCASLLFVFMFNNYCQRTTIGSASLGELE